MSRSPWSTTRDARPRRVRDHVRVTSRPTHTIAPWPAPVADGPVRATVPVPGSKSLTNRALVLAAQATAPSVILAPLRSRDTDLMAAALRSLGTGVAVDAEDW